MASSEELVGPLGVPVRHAGTVRYVGALLRQWEWLETDLYKVSVPALQAVLREEVGDGWTELACHPGYMAPEFPSIYYDEREVEIRALTDPRVKETVRRARDPARKLRLVAAGVSSARRAEDCCSFCTSRRRRNDAVQVLLRVLSARAGRRGRGYLSGCIHHYPGGFDKDERAIRPTSRASSALAGAHRARPLSYGIHALQDAPAGYVTILRDPIERVISLASHYLHWTQGRESLTTRQIEEFLGQAPDPSSITTRHGGSPVPSRRSASALRSCSRPRKRTSTTSCRRPDRSVSTRRSRSPAALKWTLATADYPPAWSTRSGRQAPCSPTR